MQDLLEHATDCTTGSQLPPHPADKKYKTLGAHLQVVNRPEQEYQIIQQYVKVRSLLLSYCSLEKRQTPFHGMSRGSQGPLWGHGRVKVKASPQCNTVYLMVCPRICLVCVLLCWCTSKEVRSTQAATEQAASAMVLPATSRTAAGHFSRLGCLEYSDGDLGK